MQGGGKTEKTFVQRRMQRKEKLLTGKTESYKSNGQKTK